MRIMVLEVNEGQAYTDLETLLDGSVFRSGIEIEIIRFNDIIEDSHVLSTRDYFEFLQSVPEHYSQEVIDKVSSRILKDIRSFDYVMCPLGDDSKGALVGYVLSWILSYTDPGAMRGAVYYANKLKLNEEPTKGLYESFIELFEFQKVVTQSGDVMLLDMPDKHKPLFTKMNLKIKS